MIDGALIGLILSGILVLFSLTRKGESAAKTKPNNIRSFTSDIEISQLLEMVRAKAPQNGYSVAFVDAERGIIVLGTGITLFSFGFFYPIFLTREGAKTRVEVGIRTKTFQGGPVKVRLQDRAFRAIQTWAAYTA